jgi:uncharacterized protein involved in exopolysaccharide biosynthesis
LADFLAFLWRHRVLIVGLVGTTTLIAIVYVLAVPVEYTAKATLLPQEATTPGLFSAALAYLGGEAAPLGLGKLSPEVVIQESILRSRQFADTMNEDLNLEERYGTASRESRLRRWFGLMKTKTNRQGLLTVSYRDRDPEFAAKVVTRLLAHLDRFNRETRTTSSRRVREFLEKRVVEAESRLRAVEDSLARYQAENQTLALDPRVEAVSALGADLLTRRLQAVTEAQVMRQTLGPRAPALTAKEMEIEALDRELARLPELASDLSKLLRSRRVLERTHTFLFAQLEETRVEEARDTPTIDILDPPVVPQEKSWPQRTYTVLLVFGVSAVLALVLGKLLDAVREVFRTLERQRA